MKDFSMYDGRLELHQHHTLWEIGRNLETELDLEEYNLILQGVADMFKEHYNGTELLFLGRSGRHVCVEDTAENRRKYHHLQKWALNAEQDIINTFNEDQAI